MSTNTIHNNNANANANANTNATTNNNTNLKPFPSHTSDCSSMEPVKDHRRRRSSSIISHVEQETFEDENDQHSSLNMNVMWVDQRGAWMVHFFILFFLKVFYNLMPGITNEWSWTLTNITYCVGSYIMFHLIKGTPFDFNGGCFDNLTMWEQINDGVQYTPSRKFLIFVPIALFLISTHYSHYDLHLFLLNLFITTFVAVVPKLPWTHRLRIFIPFITSPAQIS